MCGFSGDHEENARVFIGYRERCSDMTEITSGYKISKRLLGKGIDTISISKSIHKFFLQQRRGFLKRI